MTYEPSPWDLLLSDPPWWFDCLAAVASGFVAVGIFYTVFETVIFCT